MTVQMIQTNKPGSIMSSRSKRRFRSKYCGDPGSIAEANQDDNNKTEIAKLIKLKEIAKPIKLKEIAKPIKLKEIAKLKERYLICRQKLI